MLRRFAPASIAGLASSAAAARCLSATRRSGQVAPRSSFDRLRMRLEPYGDAIVTCGSIALVAAYAMEDVLHLRAAAVCGTASFALFYLTRNPVMRTPLLWGCVNLSINAIMISRIVAERRPVTFTEEELDVYEEHFMPFGCSARSFKAFWAAGKRATFRAGEVIQPEAVPLTSLSLVVFGRVERSAGGEPIPALHSFPGARVENAFGDAGAWIGELAILQLLDQAPQPEAPDSAAAINQAPDSATDRGSGTTAPPDVSASSTRGHGRQPAGEQHAVLDEASTGRVQRLLRSLGFYDGNVDARHGPKTERALRDFQQVAGLKPDGLVGPKTEATMERVGRTVGAHASVESIWTSRAAGDVLVMSWALEDVLTLCEERRTLKHELRRSLGHSATVKAIGMGRHQSARKPP